MFVQVIQGPVSDAAELRARMDEWLQELAPGATGWLGSTAGVTADGQFIGVVRFDTEEHARANSDRTEQDQWWAQTAKIFTAEPTFIESTEVDIDQHGDPDKAGFVQVMQGRTKDPERVRALMNDSTTASAMADARPDVIGMVAVTYDRGAYTVVNYFTSEAEARKGEKKEMPAEMAAVMKEMGELEVGQPTFFDITDPWLSSPAR
jgi:hypothetical protein